MASQPCPVPKRVGIVHKKQSAEAAETVPYVAQFLKLEPVFSRDLAGNTTFVAALEKAYGELA